MSDRPGGMSPGEGERPPDGTPQRPFSASDVGENPGNRDAGIGERSEGEQFDREAWGRRLDHLVEHVREVAEAARGSEHAQEMNELADTIRKKGEEVRKIAEKLPDITGFVEDLQSLSQRLERIGLDPATVKFKTRELIWRVGSEFRSAQGQAWRLGKEMDDSLSKLASLYHGPDAIEHDPLAGKPGEALTKPIVQELEDAQARLPKNLGI